LEKAMGIWEQMQRAEAKRAAAAQAAKPTKEPSPAEKIIEGLKEALAVAKSEAEPYRTHVKRGPKPSGKAKQLLTLRLDQDVIAGYRAKGDGWQSKINDALRRDLGL
jgi:uncharacterized protein (DUF4415 family)